MRQKSDSSLEIVEHQAFLRLKQDIRKKKISNFKIFYRYKTHIFPAFFITYIDFMISLSMSILSGFYLNIIRFFTTIVAIQVESLLSNVRKEQIFQWIRLKVTKNNRLSEWKEWKCRANIRALATDLESRRPPGVANVSSCMIRLLFFLFGRQRLNNLTRMSCR